MKKKIKLLILAHDQFGYSITKFKHCEYARNDFNITYVGWDYELPKIDLPKVKVIYVSRKSNILVRNLRLLQAFHTEIQKGYDMVFYNYVRFVALVKILNFNTKSILYIDTLGVEAKKSRRWIRNVLLTIEANFFKHIAVINAGIAKKIHVSNYHILPLGGECFSTKPKNFEHLSLLYVGTLTNRDILTTIKGFHQFISNGERTFESEASYIVVGDGSQSELKEIRDYIRCHKLENYVTTTGFVPSDKLAPFFDRANVGVAYVPITSYYQFQPPTKTFEYLISGLPVIATATTANKEIVTSEVSEIINDDANAFSEALTKLQERKSEFNCAKIRSEFSKFNWENVVRKSFIPLIKMRLKA